MSLPWRHVALLLAAGLATAAPAPELLAPGLVDPSSLIDPDAAARIGQLCDRLAEQSLELAVVVEPSAPAEPPPAARAWLDAWPAGEGDLERAVLHVSLAEQTATLAAGEGLRAQWSELLWQDLLRDLLEPAMASRDTLAVSRALARATAALAQAVGVTEPGTMAVATTPLPPPAPPRRWLRPLWFVWLPTLALALIAVRRVSWPGALMLVPWLVLLYGGIYLLLRFRPSLFMICGVATIAPLVYLMTSRPAPRAGPAPARRGGFGLGAFGAFGHDRLRRWAWR